MGMLRERSAKGSFIFLMIITSIGKGQKCEAPSSPQCFKTTSNNSTYICEWTVAESMRKATFDLYFRHIQTSRNTLLKKDIARNWTVVNEENLISQRQVDIWVIGRMGNSTCKSNNTSVVLNQTVKYAAPENVSLSWSSHNLILNWNSAEKKSALIEAVFRTGEDAWEERSLESKATKDKVKVILNLNNNLAYEVKVRQKAKDANNSMWSSWTHTLVPAEIQQSPEASLTTVDFNNGTRSLRLIWKAPPDSAIVGGVTYNLNFCCICGEKKKYVITVNTSEYSRPWTYSSVNISITTINAAGKSPSTHMFEQAKHLKTCDKPHQKQTGKVCLEWYKLADGESSTTPSNKCSKATLEDIIKKMENYVRYYYFFHICSKVPQTTEMCPIYKKEDVPGIAPQDITSENVKETSVVLSWKQMSVQDQRGFLKHYIVCVTHQQQKECRNISASYTQYLLENLTPGATYIISLAGATTAGPGPNNTLSITTQVSKNYVWLILGVLIFITILGCIIKRIKIKDCPPVPMPVIPNTIYRPSNQVFIKEDVHELTLLHLELPDKSKQIPNPAEKTFLEVYGTKDHEKLAIDGLGDIVSPEETNVPLSPVCDRQLLRYNGSLERADLCRGDSEVTGLIYSNGLMFDMMAGSLEE